MTTLTKLLLSDKLATDENGFLYRLMAGDVAKPLRPLVPRFGNPHNKRVYFKVKLDGKYVTFCQDDLKRNQQKALAWVCREKWENIETAPKDGTRILAWTHADKIEIIEWYDIKTDEYVEADNGLYRKETRTFCDGWNCEGKPIMWRPLPEPPTTAERAEP